MWIDDLYEQMILERQYSVICIKWLIEIQSKNVFGQANC